MLHAKPIRLRLVAFEAESSPLLAARVLAPVLEMHRAIGWVAVRSSLIDQPFFVSIASQHSGFTVTLCKARSGHRT